jgi:hypothetical protein
MTYVIDLLTVKLHELQLQLQVEIGKGEEGFQT